MLRLRPVRPRLVSTARGRWSFANSRFAIINGLYGDELEIKTWISACGGRARPASTPHAQRAIERASRVQRRLGIPLNEDGRPARLPDDVRESLRADRGWKNPAFVESRSGSRSPPYHTRRRVQTYELDTAQHVNHRVY